MIRSLLLCGLLLAGGAVQAQTNAPPQEELLALTFYAQQNDQTAVAAELRRLQLKYPGWQPPSDLTRLSVTAPSTEIDEIYRQIAAGQFDQARATIETTRKSFPDWQPPAEMTALLDTAEGQSRFDTALASGNLAQASSIAAEAPGLLRCDRINNAWRIAEAQAKAGRNADALATYRAIAGACVVPADLLATLEKADAVATDGQILGLIAQTGQRFPAMQADLTALQARLMAGRGAPDAGAEDLAAAPPKATAEKSAPAQSAPAKTAPRAARPAAEAPVSRRSEGSGTVTGGGGGGGSAGGADFQAAVRSENWSRCLALSRGATSAAVVYQRGWCAYNLDQPMEAISSFQRAQRGKLDATQRRDAQYGTALAYLKMHMTEEAARIAASTAFTRKQRVDIESQILDQRGVTAYNRKQYRKAIAYLDALEQLNGGLRRDLAVLRAYAWLNGGNPQKARKEFMRLNDEMSTAATRRGLQAIGD